MKDLVNAVAEMKENRDHEPHKEVRDRRAACCRDH